jgi:uroporphyrinogen decarboxylase
MTKRENLVRTITRNSPSWVPYRYDGSMTLLKPAVVARPEESGFDDWGVNWLKTGGKEGSFPDGKPVFLPDEIGTFSVPDTDFGLVTNDLREQIARVPDRDTLIIAYNELILFERVQLLLGTNNFLMATALDSDRVGRILDVITEYQLQLTESILKAGVSGVRFTDDWGTQTSLFISPDRWRLLFKPRLERLYAIVKEHDGFIFQHSCGHIEEIVPDLIEIGLDVLDPCQPQANDIFAWKKRYGGSLSFMGGLDTQGYLSLGSPKLVKDRVKEVVTTMSAGGGYIAAPSHTITIPEQNRLAMLEALREVKEQASSTAKKAKKNRNKTFLVDK